jgi:pyruvate dehydrogenase E1 component alpha subunit
MRKMAAEIDMRATGVNLGHVGSMHLSDPTIGFIGADGIVGPGAVIGAGAAFGIRAKGTKQVAVVFGGDGHFATPHFHSALNNAALLKLPFIYVIENNLYHQYAHYSYSAPIKDIAAAAATYRIPGTVVDGQDVLAVFNVASGAVERARAGEGPTLIEAKTYRYYGHSGPAGAKPGQLGAFGYDPLAITSFRPEREVKNWLARDPIEICRRTLMHWGVLDEARAAAIENAAKQEVAEAFALADASPMCEPQAGLEHVFLKGRVPARQLA